LHEEDPIPLDRLVGVSKLLFKLSSSHNSFTNSHPNNHLILSYILRGFSWKRLSKINWRIGEGIV
jgi:hypothetical protein